MDRGAENPDPTQLSVATAEALAQQGTNGQRAVEMLAAAEQQLEVGGIRAAEIVAYSCRESLMSLLRLTPTESESHIALAERVVRTYDQAKDLEPGSPLESAIESLRAGLTEGRNAKQLAAVIRERAGKEPVRFQADRYKTASDLLQRLNRAAHGDSDIEAARADLVATVELVESLFAPMSRRLTHVEELAAREQPSEQDVAELEQLAADPRVLDYFFQQATPAWLEKLARHALLQPTPAGAWPASQFLLRLARDGYAERLASWLEERLRDPAFTADLAASYMFLTQSLGSAAKVFVRGVMARFSSDARVVEATVRYMRSLEPSELVDRVALEIIERTLRATEA